jgi:hypothetical protein
MTARGGGTPALLALAGRIVGLSGRLVPRAQRGDWEREWRAELWYLHRALRASGGLSARDGAAFLLRSAGSALDALQLRAGDAELRRESFLTVAARWGEHTPSVLFALLFLSLGTAADALLLAFGRLMVGVPRSVWDEVPGELRLLILGVALRS